MAFRSSNRRMEKAWLSTGISRSLMTGNATILFSGALNFVAPGTILRMIGEYLISPTSAPAALDSAVITVGIGIVSTDAAALGATAMPDPAVDGDYPWLYWASHAFTFAGTDPQAGSDSYRVRVPFDIRSMRKFKPAQSLVMVAQYSNQVGTPPLTMEQPAWRTLIAT